MPKAILVISQFRVLNFKREKEEEGKNKVDKQNYNEMVKFCDIEKTARGNVSSKTNEMRKNTVFQLKQLHSLISQVTPLFH